ncbi:MAG: dTMP kinase [Candidatus Woesearchaeota archaeon]|nr:MAG: dTMP kinase [Candidatus Woesearchaeota archaeon]
MKRGLFVVFEGVDGSGKETQMLELARDIRRRSKYNGVLLTHEPWQSEEIKRRLAADKDAFSDGEAMSRLFVDDRVFHSTALLTPVLGLGTHVLGDRYSMSTCAYQWTQGIPVEAIVRMHTDKGPYLLTPDLTILLEVSLDIGMERMKRRGDPPEKFENRDFQARLIESYQRLCVMARTTHKDFFGSVALIDGNRPIEEVAAGVRAAFDPVYQRWKIAA